MDDEDDERTPLVGSSQVQASPEIPAVQQLEYSTLDGEPPPYSAYDSKSNPPPYSSQGPSESGGTLVPHINCRVCDSVVSVEGKLHLHVIKCNTCGEATPIRPAPTGKKYVRCPCNCLLICKATSQRIICPRPDCKRVVSLVPVATSGSFEVPPHRRIQNPTQRITCAYCNTAFLWVQPGDTYDKCPACGMYSSFGPRYRATRMKTSLISAFVVFGIAIAITAAVVYCVDDCHWSEWAYASFTMLYVMGLILFLRFLRFSCIKISQVERVMQYT